MRIGELAAMAGVSTRTVRYYHRIGLLPEPERHGNGYRVYRLRDVVCLLRARRLVELGLSLDEVIDALADDVGKELRDILAELDSDLAAQQQRIQAKRDRIAELMAAGGSLRSAELDTIFDTLNAIDLDPTAREREKLVAEFVEATAGTHAQDTWMAWQRVVADQELTERVLDAGRRFDGLAGRAPTDPAVDALAGEAREFGAAIFAQLPQQVRESAGDPDAADQLLRVLSAELAPAQVRCLRLMFDHWREVSL